TRSTRDWSSDVCSSDLVPYCHASKTLRVIVLSFSLLLIMGKQAMSQLPTATILGAVKDSSGAVIPGASITAKNVETGLTRTGVKIGRASCREGGRCVDW